MRFIEVHDIYDESKWLLNAEQIRQITENSETDTHTGETRHFTSIYFDFSDQIKVKESPDQIIALIKIAPQV